MTPSTSPPKNRGGRPRKAPVTVEAIGPVDDHPAALRDIIGQAIGVAREEMRILTIPPVSPEAGDRIRVLATWASEIRGQVVRADANVSRNKLTLPAIEKAIANLSPDERAHLAERLGADGARGSVLS